MSSFQKKLKQNSFTKKVPTPLDPKEPPVMQPVTGGALAREYKEDVALSKVKKSPVTSTPPKLLQVMKVVKGGPDGSEHHLSFCIWDTLSRVYLIHDITSGLHKLVASFELGHDNRDYERRRKYLRWLASVLPEMLNTLAENAEKEGY